MASQNSSFCLCVLYYLWVVWPQEVAVNCGPSSWSSEPKWRLWGSPWWGVPFPLNTVSPTSPQALLGCGLDQWTLCGLWTACCQPVLVSSLRWETVTYSFLAVTISGVKSLSSNFLSSDTYNGLGGGFAIILFQYLWNCAASYGFWAFELPFRYPSHKFSMIITSQLENIHLCALLLGQRRPHWLCLMLLNL